MPSTTTRSTVRPTRRAFPHVTHAPAGPDRELQTARGVQIILAVYLSPLIVLVLAIGGTAVLAGKMVRAGQRFGAMLGR